MRNATQVHADVAVADAPRCALTIDARMSVSAGTPADCCVLHVRVTSVRRLTLARCGARAMNAAGRIRVSSPAAERGRQVSFGYVHLHF